MCCNLIKAWPLAQTGICPLTPPDTTILYAEDEIIIALDTQQLLADLGYVQVTLVHNLRRAVAATEAQTFDIALLDVNLGGGETTIELGRRLRDTGVRVVFATGYNSSEMEAEHPDLIFVEKPLTAPSIAQALARSLPQRGADGSP